MPDLEQFFEKRLGRAGGEPQAVIGFGPCHTDPVYSTGDLCQHQKHLDGDDQNHLFSCGSVDGEQDVQ